MFPLKFTGTFSEKLFLYDCSIGRHILGDVRDGVARALDVRRCERHAVRVGGEHAVAVDDVVAVQPGGLEFLARGALHALVDHRADHLPVRDLLRADVVERGADAVVRHGKALRQVAEPRTQFGIRPAVLRHEQLSHPRVRLCDVDGILQPFFINPHRPSSLQFPGPLLTDPAARVRRGLAKAQQRPILLFIPPDQLLQLIGIGQIVGLGGRVVGVGVEVEAQLHAGKARLADLLEQALFHRVHQQHPPT